jgi:hypothetical protein
MIEDRKICVVLPAYNAVDARRTLREIPDDVVDDIILVALPASRGRRRDTATGSAAGLLGRGSRLGGWTLLRRCGQFS